MFVSLALMAVAAIAPTVMASIENNHEWSMVYTGMPALLAVLGGVLVFVLYFVGFLRYCASKGYSKWLGFWLLLGSFPGFITLLMLPDINIRASAFRQQTSPQELSTSR